MTTLNGALKTFFLGAALALTACEQAASSSDSSALHLKTDEQAVSSLTLTTSSGNTAYAGGGSSPAAVIDPSITVTGATTITGASVSIGSGFVAGQDVLAFTTIGAITGTYDSTHGTLTLTGSGTASDYQTALSTVTYRDSSAAPTASTRVISFSRWAPAVSNPANGHFYEFVSFNSSWAQANTNAVTRSYLGLQGYLATITSASENAFITSKLTSDGWIGAEANSLSFPRTWYWQGGPEVNEAFCYNTSAGACSVLNSLYVNWASGEPNSYGSGEACGQIYFASGGTWNDLPCTGDDLAGYVEEYGGSAGDPTLSMSGTKNVVVSYTATAIATTPSTLIYAAGSAATVVDPGVTATGTSTITSATVQIVSGLVSAQDQLAMPAAGVIGSTYSAATGVLTLTGTDTLADYQAALRTVTYFNSNTSSPTTALRSVRFAIGSANASRPCG